MCKMKLHENFDQHTFYIQNKHNKIMIKASEQDSVYIVKHIAKELNEFVLLFTLYMSCNLKITFSANLQV